MFRFGIFLSLLHIKNLIGSEGKLPAFSKFRGILVEKTAYYCEIVPNLVSIFSFSTSLPLILVWLLPLNFTNTALAKVIGDFHVTKF
jgi:hypothetical protein